MFLSAFQKDILRSFKSGETYDIYTFIKGMEEIELQSYTGPPRNFTMHNLAFDTKKTFHAMTGEKIYVYEDDKLEKVRNKLSEFIFLCDYLERIKLIRAIKLSEGANIKFIPVLREMYSDDIQHVGINDIINQLAFERYEWQFLVAPAINKFVSNDFLTDEEVHLNIETLDRRNSLSEARTSRINTRNFAIASLFVALLANMVTIYYSQKNVELFTNERKIYIVGDSSKTDTMKVILLNNNSDTINVLKNK